VVALAGVAAWVLGPFLVRVGGVLLILNGVIQLAIGQSWAWWVLAGLLVVGVGQALGEARDRLAAGQRHATRSPTGGRSLPPRVGGQGELCRETGKVKFAAEYEAEQEIERNQDLYDRGLADYRLERAYLCDEFCGWWHTTSQAQGARR